MDVSRRASRAAAAPRPEAEPVGLVVRRAQSHRRFQRNLNANYNGPSFAHGLLYAYSNYRPAICDQNAFISIAKRI